MGGRIQTKIRLFQKAVLTLKFQWRNCIKFDKQKQEKTIYGFDFAIINFNKFQSQYCWLSKTNFDAFVLFFSSQSFKYFNFHLLIIIPKLVLFMIKIIIIGLLLLVPTLAVLGVDVSQLYSRNNYTCLRSRGYRFAIIRAYRSYGAVDSNAVKNLRNAKAAKLITDIYMFPCRGKTANSQVDKMIKSIPKNLYGMVWIDVEANPSPGCSWGKNYAANCRFLKSLVNRIKYHKKKVGIYASKSMWRSIMGSNYACSGLKSQQLWYAHYDNRASFRDFSSFGGWKKPNIKQWTGSSRVCGMSVDKNYYP